MMVRQRSSRKLIPGLIVVAFGLVLSVTPGALGAAVSPAATSILDQYAAASAAVAAAVKPSVVFIQVTEKANAQDGQRGGHAEATGVVLTPSGDILTNAHVTDGASKITVDTFGGQSYPATVVASDPIRDLAVIRVKPTQPLRAATFGNADVSQAGMWVMAIGFPFGGDLDPTLRYDPSVSVGVVSAVHRDVQADASDPALTDLIQTDAAINPGNSGGPLVNSRGEVIGINEGIFTAGQMPGNIGVGFAIPIDPRTTQIVRTLQTGRSVVRGMLGLEVSALSPDDKQRTGAQYGALVHAVSPDSPAARAGLKPGDVVIGYNGQRVNSPDDLIGMIYTSPPGQTASVDVIRNHRTVALNARVAELPTA